VGEAEPFRQYDTMKAKHQVDHKFGCVTSSDLSKKEHCVGKRAKKRRVVRCFFPVADNRDSLPVTDFFAGADERAIDKSNLSGGETVEMAHGFLGIRGSGIDD